MNGLIPISQSLELNKLNSERVEGFNDNMGSFKEKVEDVEELAEEKIRDANENLINKVDNIDDEIEENVEGNIEKNGTQKLAKISFKENFRWEILKEKILWKMKEMN